jgi:dTDP-4-dehydrorhamnose reductase
MRILVTGKNGQLGQSINKLVEENKYDNEFVFVGRSELDLSKEGCIFSYFDNNNFDIIVNCAAYTAVDKAEKERGLANQINHLAVKQLAKIARIQQAKLIHISTDYVFDGRSKNPYKETDATNPINIYGKTKLLGENVIRMIMPIDAVIIRTSWMYSEYGNNFIKTILKLAKQREEINVVSDQIGSPTSATDLAKIILDIIQNKEFNNTSQKTQIYHYSSKGECSWYDFAREIVKLSDVKCTIKPIKTDQYPTLALRPKSVLMDKDKIIQAFCIKNLDWKKSLRICIKILKQQ